MVYQDSDSFLVIMTLTHVRFLPSASSTEYPNHSLASLLSLYCSYAADKRYQKADWRIRPLPEDMVHYARSDTHFLLYVYDQLRNTLLERSGGNQTQMRQVLTRSEETATKLYEKQYYDEETGNGQVGWKGPSNKFLPRLNSTTRDQSEEAQMNRWGWGVEGYKKKKMYIKLHAWRDNLARELDESPQ